MQILQSILLIVVRITGKACTRMSFKCKPVSPTRSMINQRRNAKISNSRSDIESSTLNDTESIDLQRQLLPPVRRRLGTYGLMW
jgi:hypothetical protein